MPIHPHAFIAAGEATRHAVNIVSQRLDHHHHQTISKLRASVLEMMATEVTGLQMKLVHEQCMFILKMFADQATHYMRQQEKISDKFDERESALKNAGLQSRLNEVDEQLKSVREAALLLQSSTASFLLEAGRMIIGFSDDLSIPLPKQLTDNSVIDVQ